MIGIGHHGYEHIEEDDEADRRVSPEHSHAQKLGVVMILLEAEVIQVDQTVNRPKQRLGEGKERKWVSLSSIYAC